MTCRKLGPAIPAIDASGGQSGGDDVGIGLPAILGMIAR
jgi:hypothetical protein